ncbi:MAG: LysR family transcriptional regulator [Ilumatobacteraceae bacterium]
MSTIGSIDDIDPSALRLFLAVAELGSVSRAAARMRIAQPSATAKLQKLERQLGVPLLERTATGSAPTAAGARLLPACTAAVTAVSDLIDGAVALRDAGDVLVVATTRHVAEHHLPLWLGRLHRTPISVIELDTLGVARAVRDGDAVLGFVEGPERPIGLTSRVVAQELLVPIVGPHHDWFGRRQAITIDELSAATTALPRPGSGLRDVVMAGFSALGTPAPVDVIETTSIRTAVLAAIAGNVVTYVPSCLVDVATELGTVAPLPTHVAPFVLPARIVWRGDRPATPAARTFVAAVTP